MDRELLKEKLVSQTSEDYQYDTLRHSNEIINNLISSSAPIDNIRGIRNLIIAMEELSELQKEISKAIRGKIDRVGLLEEIIDVEHSIDVLKNIYDISDEELNKIKFAKLEQIKAKCKDNHFV